MTSPSIRIRISKFLALVLRHRPEAAGLVLDDRGWAATDAVVEAIRKRFGAYDLEQLAELVAANDKGRYALSADRAAIRAVQGHSISVNLQLEPVLPPERLYHGTSASRLESIMRGGLRKAGRHHVHLSADVDTALTVGRRRAGQIALLEVDSGAMAGIPFYRSANGVWLTDHVPRRFLSLIAIPT